MRTFDFSPLFRSTIGFDRLFDLVETAQRAGEDNYPPYNIERLGATGTGSRSRWPASRPTRSRSPRNRTSLRSKATRLEKADREFLYRGISARPFKRQFTLADYVQVNGAAFDNGLLDRTGARNPRSHEAPPHPDQRPITKRRSDRSQSGLNHLQRSATAERCLSIVRNGGYHAADDRV